MKSDSKESVILADLHKRELKQMNLNEAAVILGASESTARRVFNNLQAAGKAFRVHGGIKLIEQGEYSFQDLLSVRVEEKDAIARAACELIQSGDVVYLDCGTTVLSLCRLLAHRINSGILHDVKLFTNSLANVEALSSCAHINLIGGAYRPARKDFSGFLAELVVRELNFSCCFLGADGIGEPPCAGAMDFETAALNRQVIGRSKRVYILGDSTKFKKKALVTYAHSTEMQCVITDDKLPKEVADNFSALGVQVITAHSAALL